MQSSRFFVAIVIVLALNILCFNCHRHSYSEEDLLDPIILRPYMFKTQITGQLNILIPDKQVMNNEGQITSEQYTIQMKKITQQILPQQLFNQTTLYAYGGQTSSGYKASFPGPIVAAKQNVLTKITWRNLITGKHILPVDYSYPFKSSEVFLNEVPTVPHVHGVATYTLSDGQPQSYWTAKGTKSVHYKSAQPCASNQAIYTYPNQQDPSSNWYHDHTIGITRLNVYAGLVGLYKIQDQNNQRKELITINNDLSLDEEALKYLVVTDKSFKTDGQLFYPTDSENQKFTSWVPQFFGNTILVNGVLWPKMTLKRVKHRFVFLNACQNRFLNIYFQNLGRKVPMQLIKVDGSYYEEQIIVTQLLATISSRIQFILDLSSIQGEVVLKNNADAPYPEGQTENLDPQFTGQIMKIIIQKQQLSVDEDVIQDQNPVINVQNTIRQTKYPFFQEGQKIFSTLFQVDTDGNTDAMFIDGISMMNGRNCDNSTYKIGKTYDFYIINMSPDAHPIHFHLINLQKVKQYPFNVNKYEQQYFKINGGQPSYHGFAKTPISLDPEQYRIGDDQLPKSYEKIFRDTIDIMPNYVTVLRIKFAKNDGTNFTTIDLKGQRYVWHCHMLEHQDNQMMKYFCLQ